MKYSFGPSNARLALIILALVAMGDGVGGRDDGIDGSPEEAVNRARLGDMLWMPKSDR